MQSVWAEVLTFHPSAETHLPRKRLLSRSTPHDLRQGALVALLGVSHIVSQLILPLVKAWVPKSAWKNHQYKMLQRLVLPELPSLITAEVGFVSHHMLVNCVRDYLPNI